MFIPTTTTPQAMLTQISPDGGSDACRRPTEKISVIGAGTVGTAIAYTLLVQGFCGELVLIDRNESIARGEILDLQNAAMFLDSQKLSSSSDYSATSSSRIVIVTAGARTFEADKEVAARQNTEILKEIIPQVAKHNEETILIICSYPVDEMSFVAWKLSGLEAHRVIGVGTYLESSRFSAAIANRLQVHPSCCRAFIIGEQGSKCIPVWSSVNVAGVRLNEINADIGTPDDPENWKDLLSDIIDSAEEVECLKECASWGIALSVARIVKAILNDTGECFTISTRIKGCRHGIDKDVFFSLPVILGCDGVKCIIKQVLNEDEKHLLQTTADRIFDMLKTLGLDQINPSEGAAGEDGSKQADPQCTNCGCTESAQ